MEKDLKNKMDLCDIEKIKSPMLKRAIWDSKKKRKKENEWSDHGDVNWGDHADYIG